MIVPPSDFLLIQGERFTGQLTNSSNGVPFDFTGWTGRMQARSVAGATGDGEPYFDLTTENSGITISGTSVFFTFSAAQTAAFTFQSAVYDMFLTNADRSDEQRVMHGTIQLVPRVTLS